MDATSCCAPPLNTDAERCMGPVQLQVSFNGIEFFGNLTFAYTPFQQIHSILPWPASIWTEAMNVTILGSGFSMPMWCKWWDLEPVAALEADSWYVISSSPLSIAHHSMVHHYI